MSKISNCLLCDRSLKESQVIFIENIPESAQGFVKEKEKIKRNFSTYLFQCKHCNHVQLGTTPVKYYKEVIRSVGISKDMKNIELVAILTTPNGLENRKKLKNKYKIKNDYENIDEMLSNSNIDTAFIQPNVQNVYPIAKKLLNNKINCLIEKPPALDIKKVLELERLRKKNKLISVVGFQRRFYSN